MFLNALHTSVHNCPSLEEKQQQKRTVRTQELHLRTFREEQRLPTLATVSSRSSRNRSGFLSNARKTHVESFGWRAGSIHGTCVRLRPEFHLAYRSSATIQVTHDILPSMVATLLFGQSGIRVPRLSPSLQLAWYYWQHNRLRLFSHL